MGLKERIEQILEQEQQLRESREKELANRPKIPSYEDRVQVVLDQYVEKYGDVIESLMRDAIEAANLIPHYWGASLHKKAFRYPDVCLTYTLSLGRPYGVDNDWTLAIVASEEKHSQIPSRSKVDLIFHRAGPSFNVSSWSKDYRYALEHNFSDYRRLDGNIFLKLGGVKELEDLLFETITHRPDRPSPPSYERGG